MPITLEKLKGLMITPHETLVQVAKTKNRNEALVMLSINWILLSVAFSALFANYMLIPAILVIGIIGTLAFAFIFHIALTMISGKKDFVGVLVASTYPFFGVAFSSLILAMISLFSGIFTTIILSPILFLLYFTVAIAGFYRIIKETHKIDAITVWVVTSLVGLAIFISLYSIVGIYAANLGVFLPSEFLPKVGSPPQAYPY